RLRAQYCKSDSGKIDKQPIFKAFCQSGRIAGELPCRRIAAPICEGPLGFLERNGVEAGVGAGDDRALGDPDAMLAEELDLAFRKRIVAECRRVVDMMSCGKGAK